MTEGEVCWAVETSKDGEITFEAPLSPETPPVELAGSSEA
jgi:hypothetical protein